jgi:hypothetical protein
MMTVNEHLFAMVAMAVAIGAILTVGTLLAADIIHLGPRRRAPVPETGGDTCAASDRREAPTLQGAASRPTAIRPTQPTNTSDRDKGEQS